MKKILILLAAVGALVIGDATSPATPAHPCWSSANCTPPCEYCGFAGPGLKTGICIPFPNCH